MTRPPEPSMERGVLELFAIPPVRTLTSALLSTVKLGVPFPLPSGPNRNSIPAVPKAYKLPPLIVNDAEASNPAYKLTPALPVTFPDVAVIKIKTRSLQLQRPGNFDGLTIPKYAIHPSRSEFPVPKRIHCDPLEDNNIIGWLHHDLP